MMICPDCHNLLVKQDQSCHACAWEYETQDQIPIYLSTCDKKDEMFKRYFDNNHEISVDDLKESVQNSAYLQSQSKKLYSYLPPLKGLSVCEIGVGRGMLLEHILNEKPNRLVGIDISIPYLKAIQSKSNHQIDLFIANAENLPFSNEFDVIIAADIIEHVFNVGDFLSCVNRALKPGGYFIVKAPNNEDINMYSKLQGCKYNFVHLRNFNRKSLQTVLHSAGFQAKKIIYDGFHPSRKRSFIKKLSFLNDQCDKYLAKKFTNDNEVNQINNLLGGLIMNPIELIFLTTKVRNCLSSL